MKPQQLSLQACAAEGAAVSTACRVRMAFPTLTAIAVALASSVVLTLAGCASSAGIASTAQPVAPAAAE